jgi:hypothetical protein
MNKISTKLVYIDYKELLENYKNPDFWGKRWTIYNYGNIKVELAINSINCQRNEIVMGLDVIYKGNKKRKYLRHSETYIGSYYSSSGYCGTFAVPIDHPEYSNEIFNNKVYGKVKNLILDIERTLITEFPNFKQEETRLHDLREHWKDIANEWLDDKDIEDDDIREAYISSYTSVCEDKTEDYRSEIIDQNTDKVLTKELLLFASFNKKENDVEKYSKILAKSKVSKSSIKTWLQKQKDEEIDWEDLLGEIK